MAAVAGMIRLDSGQPSCEGLLTLKDPRWLRKEGEKSITRYFGWMRATVPRESHVDRSCRACWPHRAAVDHERPWTRSGGEGT
jgi:hypothetical protein